MKFLGNLFGNKQPALEPSKEFITAGVNPFTTDVIIKSGTLLFKCPTCTSAVSVTLQQIDPIIGASLLCSSCKNISHVPGVYKTESKPAGIRITGSIRVPIVKFSDLYYEHPFIKSLIESHQSDFLNDYGLWAFCSACYHQYPSTVLTSLAMYQPMAQRGAGGLAFMANTSASAQDMNALLAGHCSQCNNKNLIVVVSEIPDYVRNVITSKKNSNDKPIVNVEQMESREKNLTEIAVTQRRVSEIQHVIEPIPEPVCPKCGNIGLPKDKFCRKCGSPIKSEIHCNNCGNIVQPKDLFCTKCGSSLAQKTAVSEKPQTDKLMEIGTSYVVIGKTDILQKNYSLLIEFINSISLPQIKSRDEYYARMMIAINGYDDDVRPLWDIPEVIEWYKELHNKHPYMPLFLSPSSVQVYFRVLGPIAHSIVPAEYRNQKDLVGLLMHTLSERNKYFSHVLGSDFESYHVILDAADKVVTDAVINLTKGIAEPAREQSVPSESLGVEKAEETETIACLVCHERTPLPQKDPPWGSAVICINCHAPLVGQSQLEEESPSYVTPQLLEKLYGMTGRALEHPRCPFCKKTNNAIVFPARGLSIGWYAVREPRDPACFSFMVHCIHCNKDFYVEWDENPLQATCRICGIQTEDSQYSQVICMDCATKASKLRHRMKLQQPPGTHVEYIFLVGFGRIPENADVSALASSKIELAPHLYTLMLSGSIPQTAVEIGLVTAEVVARNGQKKLGHEVEWGKVTYEGFRDLLLIKFWE